MRHRLAIAFLLLAAQLFPWAAPARAAASTLASYTWMADGAKYASARADGSGYVYKGALVFERNAAGKLSLDAALTTGGRITAQKDASTGAITGYTVHHHITDHLGSVRAVVDFAGNILETSDFLPYGTRWSQTGGSSSATITDATNRWRYSGKEEQGAALNPALPLIDYSARMYDPVIARWMSVDPLAEKYYPMGGYNYCAGNPICIVDPQGDTINVNNIGTIISNDNTDDVVMMQNGEEQSFLGHLNGTVNIDAIYSKLLDQHTTEARYKDPISMYFLLNTNGVWDLKNNPNTIWGLGNHRTTFIFYGEKMESQDVGNHHYGAVTKSNVCISEDFALKLAGWNQRNGPNRSEDFLNYKEFGLVINGRFKSILKVHEPPYGDDPRDQSWIKKGFLYNK